MRNRALLFFLPVLLFVRTVAAAPHSWVELDYALDDATEIHGTSNDSDDSFSFAGAWRPLPWLFTRAEYSHAEFNLSLKDKMIVESQRLGLGLHVDLTRDPALPISAEAALMVERWETDMRTTVESADLAETGLGLDGDLEARVTPRLTLGFGARWLLMGGRFHFLQISNDGNPETPDGNLDGLFFRLVARLEVTPHVEVYARYETGELDYHVLPGLRDKVEIEVDRDAVRCGARWNF